VYRKNSIDRQMFRYFRWLDGLLFENRMILYLHGKKQRNSSAAHDKEVTHSKVLDSQRP